MAESETWPQWCNICDAKLMSSAVVQSHYDGKKHRDNVEKLKKNSAEDESVEQEKETKKPKSAKPTQAPFQCDICNKSFTSDVNAQEHYNGVKHKQKLRELATPSNQTYGASMERTLAFVEKKLREQSRRVDLRGGPATSDRGRGGWQGGPATSDRGRGGWQGGPATSDRGRGGWQGGPATSDRGRGGWQGGPATSDRGRGGWQGGPAMSDRGRGGWQGGPATSDRGRGGGPRGGRGGPQPGIQRYGSLSDLQVFDCAEERGRGTGGRGRSRGRPTRQRGGGQDHGNSLELGDVGNDPGRGRGRGRGRVRGGNRPQRQRGGRRGQGDRRGSFQSDTQHLSDHSQEDEEQEEEDGEDGASNDDGFHDELEEDSKKYMKDIIQEILREQSMTNLDENSISDDLIEKVRERMLSRKKGNAPAKTIGKESRSGSVPKHGSGVPVEMPSMMPLMDVTVSCKKANDCAGSVIEPVAAPADSGSDSDTSVLSTTESVSSSTSARRRHRSRQRNKQGKPKQEKAGTSVAPVLQPDLGFDDFALFKRVVKVHCGECRVQDLINEALGSSLVAPSVDIVLQGLVKSPWFKVFKARSTGEPEKSLVIVHHNNLKLCTKYGFKGGCDLKYCPFLHLCKNFVQGYCLHQNCWNSHMLEDEHNLWVQKEKGLIPAFSQEEILSILKCSTLQVCPRYNSTGHCDVMDVLMTCPQIHVCQGFIRGRCNKENCSLTHDFDTPQAKFLLGNALYKLTKVPEDLLSRSVLIMATSGGSKPVRPIGETTRERVPEPRRNVRGPVPEPVPEPPIPAPRRKLLKDQNIPLLPDPPREPTSPLYGHPGLPGRTPVYGSGVPVGLPVQQPERPARPATPSRSGSGADAPAKSDDWTTVHIHDDGKTKPPNICEANLNRRCKHGSAKCRQNHYPVPYLWQMLMEGRWISLTNENETIEKRFSDVAENTYHIAVDGELYCLHFDEMQYTGGPQGSTGKVRRLSTRSYTEPDREDIAFTTQWRWYWLDGTELTERSSWKLYEVDSPPYQGIVESKLQGKESSCFFENGRFRYLLDLGNMKQVNLVTHKKRQVRRRPLLVTADDVRQRKSAATLKSHMDKSLLPKGWSPMNTDKFTMPDLISLKPEDATYQEVERDFYRTLSASECQIQRVIRVQNLNLWEKYKRKQKEMEQSMDGPVDERKLFHGTSDEDTVRCICKQGFDSRVSGKNGTMYGKGSYFARDANYSNNYTNRHGSQQQYMFLVRILVGKYTVGKPDYTRPPRLDVRKPDSDLYNTCVDRMVDPSIFVIFYEDQCYPEYLVEYKETLPDGYSAAAPSVTATRVTSVRTAYPTSPQPAMQSQQFVYPSHGMIQSDPAPQRSMMSPMSYPPTRTADPAPQPARQPAQQPKLVSSSSSKSNESCVVM